jgi:hypothetical protein
VSGLLSILAQKENSWVYRETSDFSIYKKERRVMESFTDLVRLCQSTGASKDPAIGKALSFLSQNPDDQQLLEFVVEELDGIMCLDLVDPDAFRPTNPISQEELPGEIKLGFVPPNGIKWGVNLDDFCCHMLITGRSGGGKSALITLILMQILELRREKIC